MPEAESSVPNTSYRRDIDGLRSIAVLSVVAYHAGASWLSGGFIGVDIFFVISGYLITSLVVQAQQKNTFTLRNFYIRRARRLFPALFVVLFVSSAAAWRLLMPGEMEDFGESLATSAAFGSNFMFWSEAGYFDGPSEFKPLLHTWSLAVEEQYYLLFPLLLLASKKSGRYLPVLLPTALVSLALSEWFVTRAPTATFFLLPHRLWELMIGSLLAVYAISNTQSASPSRWTALHRESLALVGLLAIGISAFGFSRNMTFPGINALLPTLGTACLIAAGINGNTFTSRILAAKPFVAIGLISYSLYLWHWPILVFTKIYLVRPPHPAETLSAVAVAFLMAWLSWRFIERPFRTHKKVGRAPESTSGQAQYLQTGLLPDRKVLPTSLACIIALVGTGLALDLSEGAPTRLPDSVISIAGVRDNKPPERKHCSGIPPEDISVDRLCSLGSGATPPDFILWGDSHAMVLAPRFAEVADAQARTGLNATANGCPALLGAYRPASDTDQECIRFNAAVLNLIEKTPSIKTVVLSGRWGIYAETVRYKHESGQPLELVEAGITRETDVAGSNANNSAAVWERSLFRTVQALEELDKQIVILASIPEIGWDVPSVIARSVLLKRPVTIAPTVEEFLARQRRVLPVLSKLSHPVLHPQSLLCDNSVCRASINNQPLYVDEDHLSSAGSRALLPLIRQALSESTPPSVSR